MYKPEKHRGEKFEIRAKEGILIGDDLVNAHRVLIDVSKRVVDTKEVRFDEASKQEDKDEKVKMIEFEVGIDGAIFNDLISDNRVSLNDGNQDVDQDAVEKGDSDDHNTEAESSEKLQERTIPMAPLLIRLEAPQNRQ